MRTALTLGLLALVPTLAAGQPGYQRPPRAILDVLEAPSPPTPIVSPTGAHVILATALSHPPLSDLAEPMLPLAGVRLNPRNHGPHDQATYVGLAIERLPDGAERRIALPADARIASLKWNGAGTRFAFSLLAATRVELWVGEAETGRARRLPGVEVNATLGSGFAWMADGKTLAVKLVPARRPPPPPAPALPAGPLVEESAGVERPSSTYESRDLLRTPHDADLFEYHATAQLALVDAASGKRTLLGAPSVIASLSPAPGGGHLLVERLLRPYSYLRPYDRFPVAIEVWGTDGRKVETVAELPLAERVPIRGVRTGPRDLGWRPTAPATLSWVEALDDGDTFKDVPHHDRMMMKPIGAAAVEVLRTAKRLDHVDWLEDGGRALVTETDVDKRWARTVLVDVDRRPAAPPRLVWDRSLDEAYAHPGSPVYRTLASGAAAVRVEQDAIFLSGRGASPTGDRPFLDRLPLDSLKSERLFQSEPDCLESFVAWLDPARGSFVTGRQSATDPPNLQLRIVGRPERRALTSYTDPTPLLRKVEKRLVAYKRADGVPLSFTLYLPPDRPPGTPLPTILYAYPNDYTDPETAGQVQATPNRFLMLKGASPILLALQGYAVIEATMPVVGPTATAYDSFIEQIVANARAAIDKAVELGVTDRDRVGVIGHSHGALMTATLLAWSDLFRAGVARSGAYNHTTRPFGFQNERRTLYQARDTYLRLSPLLHADKIDEPLLLIHGQLDANPGTVTEQSAKLYEAIRGTGGTARLVILPLESHGYRARESVEHTVFETLAWFDRYVKNAPPREAGYDSPRPSAPLRGRATP